MRSTRGAAVLISLLIAVPAGAEELEAESPGTCLLARRYSLNRVRAMSQGAAIHHAWNVKHARIGRAANESKSTLDKFIDAQATAGDACSSRLMEAKRALD